MFDKRKFLRSKGWRSVGSFWAPPGQSVTPKEKDLLRVHLVTFEQAYQIEIDKSENEFIRVIYE